MYFLKYLTCLAILLSLLVTGSCSLFEMQETRPGNGGPIDTGWDPIYVEDDIGAELEAQDIVAAISEAMVCVEIDRVTSDGFLPAPQTGAGTGIIIDPAGYIVTNAHVVENARTITVRLCSGREVEALDWVADTATDLAVVVIEIDEELTYAPFLRNSLRNLYVPETVLAAGNALALPGGPTWTQGVISYLGRPIRLDGDVVLENTIQTSAAINPGNSGGPLVNMAGQVVGINTAIADQAEGIGFAISTDVAIPVIERLITG